ncbi:MAG: hypothetical protein VB120_00090 [Lachnospiraceae bacterium]|nr:hypothetical protein [Lachnospiraceae bacterium]
MKKLIFVLISSAFCLAVFSGCSFSISESAKPTVTVETKDETKGYEKQLKENPELLDYSNYTINMEIDSLSNSVIAVEKVSFKNISSQDMDSVIFNIYANAFTEGSKAFLYLPDEEKDFYKYGQTYMSFEISNLTLNGKEIPFETSGTLLKIKPDSPISPGSEAEIAFQFKSVISKTLGRIGGNRQAMWFGNFIPTLGVFKDGEWITNTYTPFNKSFFTSPANYNVTITIPKGYVIAAPGAGKTTMDGDKTKVTFKTSLIRGFNFALSNLYEKSSITTDSGVVINLYTYNDIKNKELFLKNIKNDFDFYFENIGTYPYQTLDIAECELFDGNSISYPQVIFINRYNLEAYGEGLDLSSQWFGMLASVDPGRQGWLYNGINEMVKNIRYLSESRLADEAESERKLLSEKLSGKNLSNFDIALYSYKSREDYKNIECIKSSLMMYDFYKTVGKDTFFKILNTYYTNYIFKNSDLDDFINTCNEVSGQDYSSFFNYWVKNDFIPS